MRARQSRRALIARSFNPPHLTPANTIIARQPHDPVGWKLDCRFCVFGPDKQQREQPPEMRKVAGDEEIA
jgi:hypothetical protein